MENVVDRFHEVFNVYVENVAREIEEVEKFDIKSTKDDKIINFQATFAHPYLYGLLNKRNDFLMLEVKNEELLVYNTSAHVMDN